MPALNTCNLYDIPELNHVSFALPTSIFSPNLVSTLLSPLVVFGTLAAVFGFPSLLILDLLTYKLPLNLMSKLTSYQLYVESMVDVPFLRLEVADIQVWTEGILSKRLYLHDTRYYPFRWMWRKSI